MWKIIGLYKVVKEVKGVMEVRWKREDGSVDAKAFTKMLGAFTLFL